MKKNVVKLLTLVVLFGVLTMITGCDGGNSKFMGNWVQVDDPSAWMKIYKNGEAIIVDCGDGKFPATFKDGLLHISMGFGEVTAFYDEKSDEMVLTGFGKSYRFKRK
ncbi:MAG: hypothetical protein HPY58_07085 [Firmicutes bacterium]|nr:hypothetical protein [Bacillota bacterium]